jgi:uncharacterized protein (TIGR00251 family)
VKRQEAPAATFAVRVVPRASKEGVAGYEGGVLRIRLNAPPVEGKANEALARFLAKALGVPRGNVTLVSGEKGRNKIVRVDGMTPEAVLSALIPPGGPSGGDPRPRRTGSR